MVSKIGGVFILEKQKQKWKTSFLKRAEQKQAAFAPVPQWKQFLH